MTPSPKEVTQLLLDWSNGNQAALERLTPLVYEELHRLAHQHMSRERRHQQGHTLQTSALVNELICDLLISEMCTGRIDLTSFQLPPG